ncbi:WcbI family polysaccharide biosynthesis putative acetyltransferase [Mycolicibacterium sp. P1-18]|uniref:WcbI family polysaccharide biosynthesis putative acetyltransferase n=1 Tax=Mycolicibacterium sp. P1-18 TaxID=2024615 RepID=UPI001F5B0179|nr:WcbI family polysaccharide biosynthesis putative acetyltransferase [Mycolicibacterium sp. P1-18]
MHQPSPRTRHYGDFYRVGPSRDDESRPLWLVVGNCQAEALRLVLDGVDDRPYTTVRMPPVHELERSDLPYLRALLGRAAVLLSQPIRDGYRDLPLGTAELAAALPRTARVVRWPVIRYAGLHPFQAIVRHPADRSVVPPVVPYHDLRTVVAARDGKAADDDWDVEVDDAAFVAVAEASQAELARREGLQCDVGVSDVLGPSGADAAHTVNHPGNGVLTELGRRALGALGVTASVPVPARTLLGSAIAPLEPRVLRARGIVAPGRVDWWFDGAELRSDDVHRAQLQWYRDNPDFIGLAVERHAHALDLLGLGTASGS